jgi:hypothetical protein
VRVNSQPALQNFIFGQLTGYIELPAGDHLIEILPTGTDTVAISGTVSLDPAVDYTLAAIGNETLQPLELFTLIDDNVAPESGGKVRIVHLAPFAAELDDTRVDICTQDGQVVDGLTGIPYKGFTDPYLELPTGSYDLIVAAAGSSCETILIDLPAFHLDEGEILSVFATGDGLNFPPSAVFFPEQVMYKIYLPLVFKSAAE